MPRGLFGPVTKTQLWLHTVWLLVCRCFLCCDLSHPSAGYCTYCSHTGTAAARLNELGCNWVMTSKKLRRPVMSLCVRAVISSTCKYILVQLGWLIYSSKCNSINFSLISLVMHISLILCGGKCGKKCGAAVTCLYHRLLFFYPAEENMKGSFFFAPQMWC